MTSPRSGKDLHSLVAGILQLKSKTLSDRKSKGRNVTRVLSLPKVDDHSAIDQEISALNFLNLQMRCTNMSVDHTIAAKLAVYPARKVL